MDKKILYKYELLDSCSPYEYTGITIPEEGNKVYSPFQLSLGTKLPEDWKGYPISQQAKDEIRTIIRENSKVFSIQELEQSPYIFVLDGYCQRFTFGNGEVEHVIEGCNIQHCEGDYEYCPNSALMIDILHKIRDILVPEGVDESYFHIGNEPDEEEYEDDEDI